MYRKFMRAYIETGHMSLPPTISTGIDYYFPQHGIVNEGSETTMIRIIFNGSTKTETGVLFNDLQYNEPKLQED